MQGQLNLLWDSLFVLSPCVIIRQQLPQLLIDEVVWAKFTTYNANAVVLHWIINNSELNVNNVIVDMIGQSDNIPNQNSWVSCLV